MGKKQYAKDFDCVVCGKQAAVFWPVVDPDIPSHPHCKKCVKEARDRVLIEMFKADEKQKKDTKT